MPRKYERIAQAVFGEVWGIEPEKYEAICDFVEARMNGEATDADKFEFSQPEAYTTRGVKVIPVCGTMFKRAGMFTEFSGGVSYETIGKQIQEALADTEVSAIVLRIDSSGGLIDGSISLTDFVYQSRGVKPIVAFGDGAITSAAQLLACACSAVVASPTTRAGSLGAVTRHVDKSLRVAMSGYKYTYVTSGKLKAIGNQENPLDAEGFAYIKERIDEAAMLMFERIAKYRGKTTKQVVKMADEARVYSAKGALKVGLIDQIGECHDAIARALELVGNDSKSPWGGTLKVRGESRERSNTMPQTYAEALGLMRDGRAEEVAPEHLAKITETAEKAQAVEQEEASDQAKKASKWDNLKAFISGGKEQAQAPTEQPKAPPEPAGVDMAAVLDASAHSGMSAQEMQAAIQGCATTAQALDAVKAHRGRTNEPLAHVPHSRETALDPNLQEAEQAAGAGLDAMMKELGLAE